MPSPVPPAPPPPPGRRSALVVEIPEAEPVVGPLRARLDPSAAGGVPAHVTVLYPFLPPERLDGQAVAAVDRVVAGVPVFGYRFVRTAWFGEQVLWLAPEDPAPFRTLTTRLHAAFPECPPYGGQFADVVPHLTVGDGQPPETLRAAEREVTPRLPVAGRAVGVGLLVEGDDGRWSRRARFALAGAH